MYYRQPRYFKDFHCVGGSCDNTCCVGWRIDWYQNEIDKVKAAPNCSAHLKELLEKSLKKIEDEKDKYSIILADGRCPFLTEDNFCGIQRELGEKYLSYTCSNYPRNYLYTNALIYRSCRMSCPEIMRSLLNNKNALDLTNHQIKANENISVLVRHNTDEEKQKTGVGYYPEIFEFFYELISDKKRDVEDSLVLGLLAAQSLSKLVEQNKAEHIPEALKSLKAQMYNAAQLDTIRNIKPNYNIKLGIGGQMLHKVCSSAQDVDTSLPLIDESGKFNIDYYREGEKQLYEFFEDQPFVMRNLALNILFEHQFPFKNTKLSIFESYAVYLITFAMFKLNTIAIAELQNRVDKEKRENFDMEKYLIRSGSMISRTLCQGGEIEKIILRILKDNKMFSPAYLALFIK